NFSQQTFCKRMLAAKKFGADLGHPLVQALLYSTQGHVTIGSPGPQQTQGPALQSGQSWAHALGLNIAADFRHRIQYFELCHAFPLSRKPFYLFSFFTAAQDYFSAVGKPKASITNRCHLSLF